jgi:hypothetical protein
MESRSWIFIAVILVVFFGVFYIILNPIDGLQNENLEWLKVGAEATYVQKAILSPGILHESNTSAKWRVINVYRESFRFDYVDYKGAESNTIEFDSIGNFYVCLLNLEPTFSENYVVEEKIIQVENFGALRVYEVFLETEVAIWSGIYEANTGILIELDVRGKESYKEGELMGLYTILLSTNVNFENS